MIGSKNQLKSNPDKCYALVGTNKNLDIKIDYNFTISNSDWEKLGVKIDVNSNFNNHISDLSEEHRKIFTLAPVTTFVSFHKQTLLMNVFFTSHFSYCAPT